MHCQVNYVVEVMTLRKWAVILVFILLTISFCGCFDGSIGNYKSEEVVKNMDNDYDNVRFMMEKYGLRSDELSGLDLERFINDYQLRIREYSSEDIRRILDDEGDMYQDDGTTALFSILNATGERLKIDDSVTRIGLYVNSGTIIRRAVFDIEQKVFYVQTTEPHPLSEERIQILKSLPEQWDIFSWEQHCVGEENPSTGNFGWKLVFGLSNGNFSVYDGYTQDMSHLPNNFQEVYQQLNSILKTVD